jgi:hypothetical protein
MNLKENIQFLPSRHIMWESLTKFTQFGVNSPSQIDRGSKKLIMGVDFDCRRFLQLREPAILFHSDGEGGFLALCQM